MKNVMSRAWEISKAAVVKFGGKAKMYFATALKMAWKEAKINAFIAKLSADVKKLSAELTVSEWKAGNNHRIYINFGRKAKGYLVLKNYIVADFENNASAEMMGLLRSYVGRKVA